MLLVSLFTTLVQADEHPYVYQTFGEKGDVAFRDLLVAGKHVGHAAIYIGNNAYTDYKPLFVEAGKWNKDIPVRVADFECFLDWDQYGNPNEYWGIRGYSLNSGQRNVVVGAALAQLGCSYPLTFCWQIKDPSSTAPVYYFESPYPSGPYWYMPSFQSCASSTGGVHSTKGDGHFRCDGLAEYAYEKAGVNSGTGLFSSQDEAASCSLDLTGTEVVNTFETPCLRN